MTITMIEMMVIVLRIQGIVHQVILTDLLKHHHIQPLPPHMKPLHPLTPHLRRLMVHLHIARKIDL